MQTVTPSEIEIFDRQDPRTENDGGFQQLLVELQDSLNRHEEKIPRYAFDYKNGGWEDRLKGIFSRMLGENLGH
jgi:hypothetical protein